MDSGQVGLTLTHICCGSGGWAIYVTNFADYAQLR